MIKNETSTNIEKYSEEEIFLFLIQYASENKFSLALWHLPNSTTKQIILSQQYNLLKKDQQIEDLPSGFIFAPFDKEKDRIFLPSDFSFRFENKKLKPSTTPLETNSLVWLNEQIKTFVNVKIPSSEHHELSTTNTGKSEFVSLVEKGIDAIEKGVLDKVVLSRRKTVNLPPDFEIVNTFQRLCDAYNHAMISFVAIPDIGSWLGASPELLVQVEDGAIFKTIALAGTKPLDGNINIKSVAWTQKEIEEQALVERYIISCFKKIRLREYDEHGPKTVVAGNLMHLKSDFTVDMNATGFPQLGSTMLQLLHPTSAVCGMPLEASLDFLKRNEGYDREFYAGYLGPINYNNNTNIFVNLRCMKLTGDKAILFSGAGVTCDSNPEAEWEETELKYNTLLNIILHRDQV